MIDYPGQLSAVIFTMGCTFRCPFCYNPMLVLSGDDETSNISPTTGEEEGHSQVSEDDLFHFLAERKGRLDAVVISGGEPTIQRDLPEFIRRVRALGYLVKLDTNGTDPEMLEKIIKEGSVDYLAMDIKAAPDDYPRATGVNFDFEKIRQSVKLIMNSGIPYELRTTCVPGFIDEKAIEKMGELIAGADKWYLQKFRSNTRLIDRALEGKMDFTDQEMADLAKAGQRYVKSCEVRG